MSDLNLELIHMGKRLDMGGSWKREVEPGLREAKGMWLQLAATNTQLYVGEQKQKRQPSLICYFRNISIKVSILQNDATSSIQMWFTENVENRPMALFQLFLWASARESVWERYFLTFFKSCPSWRKWQNNLILMVTEAGSRVLPPSIEHLTITCVHLCS